jgi:DMSO/TMAO reductase YedYZ molybdopterin-dependent catalytic subunit
MNEEDQPHDQTTSEQGEGEAAPGGAGGQPGGDLTGDSRVTGAAAAPHEMRHTRRRFLLIAGAVAAGLAGGLAVVRRLGGSGGDATGGAAQSVKDLLSSFPINSVERTPNKTWDEWTLKVDGLVGNPLKLDAAAWKALPRSDVTADFHCVEGWSVSDVKWGGVTPAAILQRAQARPEGAYVVFHAYTGEYVDTLPIALAMDPQTILADMMDGVPLPAEHGGPLRLVVPEQYGYKSVKWVTRVEVTDKPVPGYWEQRGYPSNAALKAPTERWGPAPIDME